MFLDDLENKMNEKVKELDDAVAEKYKLKLEKILVDDEYKIMNENKDKETTDELETLKYIDSLIKRLDDIFS